MRRPLFSCLLMLLALATASCSGGEKTETAAEQKTAREEATGAKVAPVLARPDLLAGGWLRPAREAGREGLSITPDGTLRLVGYLQSGLDWSLDGDVLVLRTLVPQAREPIETRLHVQHLDESTLSLEGVATEMAGAYRRAELGRATATVEAPQPLGEREMLYVRLYAPLVPEGPASASIAFQGVAAPVEWPVSIDLVYDPEAVPAGAQLEMQAVVLANARTLQHSPRAPVPPDSASSGASLVLPPW